MAKKPEIPSILRLSQALGLAMPGAPKHPPSGPAWRAESHGATHYTGYLIRWEQLKTVADARYWVHHIGRFHPAMDADALARLIEEALQFQFSDDRPSSDFLGTSRKVRHYLRHSRRRP